MEAEDKIWEFNAPQHYFDLPTVLQDDDSEQADQYFFAKCDDTVYYEPDDGDASIAPEGWEDRPEEQEEYPVMRRRSRSVGSVPLFLRKPDTHPTTKKAVEVKKEDVIVENVDQHFADGLRAYQPSNVFAAPKVTQPRPFNLTMPKRRVTASLSNGPSMAEGVQKWETKTPERFHSLPRGEFRPTVDRVVLTTTTAHTPQLNAIKRHRPVHAMNREARERLEFEEMKKNQFKAHPVDDKVFKAPSLPAKKTNKPTEISPFHLTEVNKKENISPIPAAVANYQFHAKPAPKLPPVQREFKHTAPTIPSTPNFSKAGKASLQLWRHKRSKSNETLMSGGSSGSMSSLMERLKNTKIQPFSFEDRDKQLQRKREMKIKKIMEEERKLRDFHANPCPSFQKPFTLPDRSLMARTEVTPFKLSCDTRGLTKKEKFLKQVEEMRVEGLKALQFKAQPAKVLTQEPFKVKLDHNKTMSLPPSSEFHLSTERCAAERRNYDEYLKAREKEMEAAKQELELRRQQEMEKEVHRLRQEATFVAQPIRQSKPLEIMKSDSSLLTVPKTPKLSKPMKKVN